mmetsp:Transcript_22104/g.42998  ORF Transcript_22104/g.42998 Transcript_22104/m.42998 type:complete len:549 (+) Transcript_22104:990-2636(+)
MWTEVRRAPHEAAVRYFRAPNGVVYSTPEAAMAAAAQQGQQGVQAMKHSEDARRASVVPSPQAMQVETKLSVNQTATGNIQSNRTQMTQPTKGLGQTNRMHLNTSAGSQLGGGFPGGKPGFAAEGQVKQDVTVVKGADSNEGRIIDGKSTSVEFNRKRVALDMTSQQLSKRTKGLDGQPIIQQGLIIASGSTSPTPAVAIKVGVGGGERYRGVYPTKSNKWQAKICRNGTLEHLGTFSTAIEAAKVWDKRALQLGKKPLNFPSESMSTVRKGETVLAGAGVNTTEVKGNSGDAPGGTGAACVTPTGESTVAAVKYMGCMRDTQSVPSSKPENGDSNAFMDAQDDAAEDDDVAGKIHEVWSMIMESHLAQPLMDPPADVSPEVDDDEGGYTAVRKRLEAGELTTLDSFYEAHGGAIRFALLSEEQQGYARELDRFVVDSVRDVFPSIDEGTFDLQPEPSMNSRSDRGKTRKARPKKDLGATRRSKSKMGARGVKQDEKEPESPVAVVAMNGTKKKRGTRSATRRAPARRKAEPADDDASRRRGRPRKAK